MNIQTPPSQENTSGLNLFNLKLLSMHLKTMSLTWFDQANASEILSELARCQLKNTRSIMIHTFPTSSVIPSLHLKTHSHLQIPPTTTRTSNVSGFLHCAASDGNRKTSSKWAVLRSNDPDIVVATGCIDSATSVVRKFYEGINCRGLALVEYLIAQNCVYEDLVFPKPFVGRKAILEFFDKFMNSISSDLQFAIDDISEEDASAVGVTWHLEWKGKTFPFSKGCSFYRLDVINGQRQIVYGRDCVEPAIKPGETALVAIRGVTWLLQKFPALADKL